MIRWALAEMRRFESATPRRSSSSSSFISTRGSITTPLPTTHTTSGLRIPDGTRWNLNVSPPRTIVCPALLPPWKRITRSACSASRSTTFPFPSSPHWAPTITSPGMRRIVRPLTAARPAVSSTTRLINHADDYDMAVDQLSTTFAALADPTRRAIMERLAEGEATVNELAEPFPISGQAVSKHLRVLEGAGLIERGRAAQRRPSRLRGPALRDASEWLDAYRVFW